jgi:chromosome segregation ATPase
MSGNESSAVTKIIEEYKSMEMEYQRNADELLTKNEELESKKTLLNTLKEANRAVLEKIASLKKEIESDKNAQQQYAGTKAEYDRLAQLKNDMINRTKKAKISISQKKTRIRKLEIEMKQIDKSLQEYKDTASQENRLTDYDNEINRREQLIKEQDELKINISYLKKSNNALNKDIEEMEYILKRLENSLT